MAGPAIHGKESQMCRPQAAKRSRLIVSVFYVVFASGIASALGLSLVRDVAPMGKEGGAPRRLVRAQDGGLLVLMETPALLVKLDIRGEKKWSYRESGEGVLHIRSIASDTDNGVILCIDRFGGERNVYEMPNSVVRLDASGHEIARLDSGTANITGGAFYKVAACERWSDGYLVIARNRKTVQVTDPRGKQFSEWTSPGVIIKLREDFSIEWRKDLDLHSADVGITGGIKFLSNGDAVIAGFDRVAIIDGAGDVKEQTTITQKAVCMWLRTEVPDNRIRMACNEQERAASSVIIELDSSLKTVSTLELGTKNNGLAIVCEMQNGVFGLLGADEQRPFVSTFPARGGAATSTYHFPSSFPEYASPGNIADCLPIGPSSLAVLRSIDKNSATPIVSWVTLR
jgi:hypothetical protein